MKNSQNGFVGMIVLIVLVLGISVVGIIYYFANQGVVDPQKLNQAVLEKNNNPAGKRMVIRDGLRNIVSTFVSEEVFPREERKEGFEKICNIVPDFLDKKAKKWMSDPNIAQENAGLGITLESYRLSEYKCKSSADSFVFTVPFEAENGTDGTVCVTKYTSDIGAADFENLICTWKRI